MARHQLGRKNPLVWVPLTREQVVPFIGDRPTSTQGIWTVITLENVSQIGEMGPLFKEAYSAVKKNRLSGDLPSDGAAG